MGDNGAELLAKNCFLEELTLIQCSIGDNGALFFSKKVSFKNGFSVSKAFCILTLCCVLASETTPHSPPTRLDFCVLLSSTSQEHGRTSVEGIVRAPDGTRVQSGSAHNGAISVLFSNRIQCFVELVDSIFLLKQLKLHSTSNQATQANTN